MISGPKSPRRYLLDRTSRKRSGLFVLVALTCLLIVSAIVVSMLQSAIRMRRQLHTQRDLCQTELLLHAGAERAASRLKNAPDFSGDTWELPAEAIAGHGSGRVTTQVTRSDSDATSQIHAVAEYPLDRGFPVRRSHTFNIPNPADSAANPSEE